MARGKDVRQASGDDSTDRFGERLIEAIEAQRGRGRELEAMRIFEQAVAADGTATQALPGLVASRAPALVWLAERYAVRPCAMCTNGLETCDECKGRGATESGACDRCAALGVVSCPICAGSSLHPYGAIPLPLLGDAITRRVALARERLREIQPADPSSRKALVVEILHVNRARALLDNALDAVRNCRPTVTPEWTRSTMRAIAELAHRSEPRLRTCLAAAADAFESERPSPANAARAKLLRRIAGRTTMRNELLRRPILSKLE